MKAEIKFIYFDLGGVVFYWREGLNRLAEIAGRSLEEVIKVFDKYDNLACQGKISPQELWNRYRKELEIKMDENFNFLDFWTDSFSLIAETHRLVKELVGYYPLGLLVNIYKGTFPLAIKKGFVPKLNYSVVVQSCYVGLVKPDKKIFQFAQKQAGVPASAILFIDDSSQNIKAAENLGWNSILFEENQPAESIRKIRSNLNLR